MASLPRTSRKTPKKEKCGEVVCMGGRVGRGEHGTEIKLEEVLGYGWSFLVPLWEKN